MKNISIFLIGFLLGMYFITLLIELVGNERSTTYRYTFHGDTTYLKHGDGLIITNAIYDHKLSNGALKNEAFINCIPLTDTLKIISIK